MNNMNESEQQSSIRELVPLLNVRNIVQSVAFYCDRLGFKLAAKWEPEGRLVWCRIEREGSALMLQEGCEEDGPMENRGCGVTFYFICDDADRMYDELRNRGLNIAPPETAFYGMKQIHVQDPDGYELWFESPVDPA